MHLHNRQPGVPIRNKTITGVIEVPQGIFWHRLFVYASNSQEEVRATDEIPVLSYRQNGL